MKPTHIRSNQEKSHFKIHEGHSIPNPIIYVRTKVQIEKLQVLIHTEKILKQFPNSPTVPDSPTVPHSLTVPNSPLFSMRDAHCNSLSWFTSE